MDEKIKKKFAEAVYEGIVMTLEEVDMKDLDWFNIKLQKFK